MDIATLKETKEMRDWQINEAGNALLSVVE